MLLLLRLLSFIFTSIYQCASLNVRSIAEAILSKSPRYRSLLSIVVVVIFIFVYPLRVLLRRLNFLLPE